MNLVVVLGPHRPRRLQYSNVGDNRGVACARAVAVLEGAQRPKKSASVALDVCEVLQVLLTALQVCSAKSVWPSG